MFQASENNYAACLSCLTPSPRLFTFARKTYKIAGREHVPGTPQKFKVHTSGANVRFKSASSTSASVTSKCYQKPEKMLNRIMCWNISQLNYNSQPRSKGSTRSETGTSGRWGPLGTKLCNPEEINCYGNDKKFSVGSVKTISITKIIFFRIPFVFESRRSSQGGGGEGRGGCAPPALSPQIRPCISYASSTKSGILCDRLRKVQLRFCNKNR